MNISVEVKNIHDLLMLDTIIDLWKAKWKAEESDDADDEPEDCDDEPAEADDDDDAEEEARQKAVDELVRTLRGLAHGDVDCSCGCDDHRKSHRC